MFGRKRPESDFAAEIQAHLDHETERLINEGMSPDQARAIARRAFGNRTAVQERFYETRRPWADELSQDIRFALRTLRRNPGFAVTAIATLALGIGANTAIFTAVNAVALRPLPYPQPEELVWMTQVLKASSTDEITITPDFLDWRRMNQSFRYLAAFNYQERNLTESGEPVQLLTARASADVLPMLGVQPMLGRNFVRQEDLKGHDRVVILGHGLWARRFGNDPKILGRKIILDGEPYEVIGVLPANFLMPADQPVELLAPLGKDEEAELKRGKQLSIVRNVIGRLKPGISSQQAMAELNVIQASLPELPWKPKISIKMAALSDYLVRDTKRIGWTLLAATGLLLLIACSNVTNLLLAQAARREQEIALRTSLGGSRARLIRQLLTEGLMLSACATLGGLAIAWWTRGVLLALSPQQVLGLSSLPIDWRVVGFSILVAVSTTLIFGVGPALRLTRTAPGEALKAGGPNKTADPVTRRFLAVIASGEIALTLALLVAAGLLFQSFLRMRYRNLGFQPDRLIVATLKPDRAGVAFLEQILEQTRTIPGVESAALTELQELPPGGGHATNTFFLEGSPVMPAGRRSVARHQPASADYFPMLGIPLRQGRLLTDRDGAAAPRVVLVNDTFVKKFLTGEDPLGKRIGTFSTSGETEWRAIVGVVGDVKTSGLAARPEPTIFYPYQQTAGLYAVALVARTAIDPTIIAAEIRSRIAQLNPRQPVASVETMNQRLSASVTKPRFVSVLLAAFAALALVLGLVGVYGVMACCLRWRTRELAIRQALGAAPGDVRSALLRQGAAIILPGVAIGLAGALAVTGLLRGFLFDTPARDPVTFAAAAALLAGSAFLACWAPAQRASRIDPATVLRSE